MNNFCVDPRKLLSSENMEYVMKIQKDIKKLSGIKLPLEKVLNVIVTNSRSDKSPNEK